MQGGTYNSSTANSRRPADSLDAALGFVVEDAPHVLEARRDHFPKELYRASRQNLHHVAAVVVFSFLRPTEEKKHGGEGQPNRVYAAKFNAKYHISVVWFRSQLSDERKGITYAEIWMVETTAARKLYDNSCGILH